MNFSILNAQNIINKSLTNDRQSVQTHSEIENKDKTI